MESKKSVNLIGLVGRPNSGCSTVANIIKSIRGEFELKHYTTYIEEIIAQVTGIPAKDLLKDDIRNSYLSQEWSYVREERFVDASGVNRKPVRYYLTPATMIKRLDAEVCRQVHSNFLVNALFVKHKPENHWVVCDVWFPNEADIITEKGGILIKVTRKSEGKNGRSNDFPLEKWPFDYTIENNGTLADLEQKVKTIVSDFK